MLSQQRSLPAPILLLPLLLILPLFHLAAQDHSAWDGAVRHDEIRFCGELPQGSGGAPGEEGLVDRFNNVWQPSKALIRAQAGVRRAQSGDCGGFRIDFEDVIEKSGYGFDDPTPIDHAVMGRTTLGELRRRTVCEVFRYVGETIEIQGSPDVIVRRSVRGPGLFIAAASPFFPDGGVPAISSGLLHQHITTGTDPTPDAGDYDALLIFDFGYSLQPDWSAPSPGLDLYSVALHEATHALGFLSLIAPDGSSRTGNYYSHFDLGLRDADDMPLIDPVRFSFRGMAEDIVSDALAFEAPQCSDHNPVYSPTAYRQGSSTSHFDSYRSGIRYVMRPSTSGGEDRVYTQPELRALCQIGYRLKDNGCGRCLPRGIDDVAATRQEREVCIDVLANDESPDGSALQIDPASVVIEVGGGAVRLQGNELCYTPSAGFIGVARLRYAPANGEGRGLDATVMINVTSATPFQPGPRRDGIVWRFPEQAGIDFSSGVPVPMQRSPESGTEGCASICHPRTGALLFYTNGAIVWDAENRPMPNGRDVGGNWSSTQSSLIVPKPGDSLTYYIFLTGAEPLAGPTPGLRYAVVDMRLNEGSGDVTQKGVELFAPCTEMLSATRHCNGRDYWVATHEVGSNRFRSYLVTPDGISSPVYSDAGPVVPMNFGGMPNWAGALKFSTDGRRAATASLRGGRLDLFDFDRATGTFSNAVALDSSSYPYYGLSFSPDNSRLYASARLRYLFQFDLKAGDVEMIRSSRVQIPFPETNGWMGQMQIGPDRRIYLAAASTLLGVISDPDSLYPACNFNPEGFHLQYAFALAGLPNLIDYDLFASTLDSSQLRISKRVNDTTPRYHDTISYTITVCNAENCMDATAVMIEDQLPAGLRYLDGLDDYPHHTFDTIPAGECRSIVLRALVTPQAPLAVPITNCAAIVQSSPGHGYIPLDDNCATIVLHGTDLGIVKEVDRPEAESGSPLVYTITVTNYGPEQATGVVVLDPLPTSLRVTGSSIIEGTGIFDSADGTLSIPSLDVGSRVVLRLVCRIADEASGTITNCAHLAWVDQNELDITNNRSCIETRIDGCDIAITKEVDVAGPRMGERITYTIMLTNLKKALARDIVVKDLLPAGVRYLEHHVDTPGADYDPVTGLLHLPHLAGGDTARLHIVCTVDSSGSGEVVNCAELAAVTPVDLDTLNDRSCSVIRPRWCNEPELTGRFSIPRDLHTPFDRIIEVPVHLHDRLDDVRITRLRIAIGYDTTALLPGAEGNLEPRIDGTLLEGWRIIAINRRNGVYIVELEAPQPEEILRGVGTVLRIPFRMYVGSKLESDMQLRVDFPGNRCAAASTADGHIRLDSLCGLSLRLVDIAPDDFAIKQARPNPFNPVTTIDFSLGLDGPVRLTVVNSTGEVVDNLVDNVLAAGEHSVQWNAMMFPSGLYFCRLDAGTWRRTIRLILVK